MVASARAASFAVPYQPARIGYSVIFEFVREFRAQEGWRAVPVVVVTAKHLSGEDRARLNGGVERILQTAAYSREALLEEVRDLVIACVARRGPAR